MARNKIADLRSSINGKPSRGITKQELLDMLDSTTGTLGIMSGKNQTLNITDQWQNFDGFTAAARAKGLLANIGQGRFTVQNGSGGEDWMCDIAISVHSQVAGWLEFGITVDGVLTEYTMKRSLTAGGYGMLSIPAIVDADDLAVIGLQVRGDRAFSVEIDSGVFRVSRTG